MREGIEQRAIHELRYTAQVTRNDVSNPLDVSGLSRVGFVLSFLCEI